MANSINFVGLSGNLGADAQITQTPNGKTKATFNIANNREYTQNGEKQRQTSWFRCVWVGNGAEALQNYLVKGKNVFVQGRLESREYEKDGERKTITEIYVNDLQLLSDGSGQQGENRREPAMAGASRKTTLFEDDTENLPF